MAFFVLLGAAASAIDAILNTSDDEPIRVQTSAITSLRNEASRMREEADRTRRNMETLVVNEEKRQQKALVKLARRTEAIRRQGNNIGIFGLTSTGKSTMVNSLLGKKVADTGVGETTKEITQYQGTQYTLWDAPGRNDELICSDQKYISFIKGLTRRLILTQYTIKENLNFMRLLDDLRLDYDIIVNKFDDVDEDERAKFQRQIHQEIISLDLKYKKNVFFLSAQYPRMFPSWLKMVNYLTTKSNDA